MSGAGAMPAPPGSPNEEGHGKKGVTDEMLALVKNADKVNGLSAAKAAELLAQYGPNELASKHVPKWLIFAKFLVLPMSIAIWIAVIIECVQAAITGQGWEDFGILLFLQFLNAIIGFVEEIRAGDAVAKLKGKLAPQANVCRDGSWHELPAKLLVPGDLIDLKLGDVIPADAIILDGYNPVDVDQSALTGESLPASLGSGGHLKMGSMLKTGQIRAIVVATGSNTFFGDAAKLISSVDDQGHLRGVINSIVLVMCSVCVVFCVCIFARLMTLTVPPQAMTSGNTSHFLQALSVVVVILVASIPVAIEVVSTSTLAVGSHIMSAKQVIVAKLSAIEELAGMTVLCSDKTGTLTLNQLRLDDNLVTALSVSAAGSGALLASALGAKGSLLDMSGAPGPEGAEPSLIDVAAVKKIAALASKRDGKPDAIDTCIVNALAGPQAAIVGGWVEAYAIPFDPISKRTIVTVTHAGSSARVKVCKGAPQKVLEICNGNKAEVAEAVNGTVKTLAGRGFRALGVALCANPAAGNSSENGIVGDEKWYYVGIVPLFDPPRPDTRKTIEEALKLGIEVKMITGDQTAIAKETCRQLGMGANILESAILDSTDEAVVATLDNIIMEAHGFAEVMPKHKFAIVEKIRQLGHITGMTGDGVNDAPALKRADIGIAVHGATDAAKAAASIVLTEPGLSVIIDAIIESRRIFQRMRSYFLYRISCTVQLLLFFFFIIICANADGSYFYQSPNANINSPMGHNPVFSLPVLALVILTLINDGACIAVSSDTVAPDQKPQMWSLKELWIVGTAMGMVGAFSSLILCTELMHANIVNSGYWMGVTFGSNSLPYVTFTQVQTIVYLQLGVSNMMSLYSARTKGAFFTNWKMSTPLAFSFMGSFLINILLALFWGDIFADSPVNYMAALVQSKGAVIATLIYCAMWFLVQDAAKCLAYFLIDKYKPRHEAIIEANAQAHHANTLPDADHHPAGVVDAAARIIAERAIKHGSLPAIDAKAYNSVGLAGANKETVGKSKSAALAAQLQYANANVQKHKSFFQVLAPSSGHGPVDTERVQPVALPNGIDMTAVVAAASLTVSRANAGSSNRQRVDQIFHGAASTAAVPAAAAAVPPKAAEVQLTSVQAV